MEMPNPSACCCAGSLKRTTLRLDNVFGGISQSGSTLSIVVAFFPFFLRRYDREILT